MAPPSLNGKFPLGARGFEDVRAGIATRCACDARVMRVCSRGVASLKPSLQAGMAPPSLNGKFPLGARTSESAAGRLHGAGISACRTSEARGLLGRESQCGQV